MNLRPIASSLLVAILAAAPLARAQDSQPAPSAPPPAGAPAKAPKTALEKDMDKINKSFRALRKQIGDASQNDASLALLATIRDAAVAAQGEKPAWTSEQPAADQDKFVSDFQAKMKDFVADVDKVIAALKSGDNDGAKTLLAQLGKDERAGHKEFRKPEKKD